MQSGITDQYIYFVGVDDATGVRKTGLSSFTVYRSRNGAAAVAYTTPTINETDATNMPGVYELLMDEDMTIDAGDDSQEICLHITATGMLPVTRTIELYRPTVTAGQTLTVTSGLASANAIQAAGVAWGSGAITAASIASNAITSAKIATGAITSTQLAAGAITAASIASNAITSAKIATGAITSTQLAAGAITAASIAADAIGASELAADAVTEIVTGVWAAAARTLTAGTNITLAKGTGITGFNDLDAAGVATAVWNAATATYGSAGTYGLLVETNLDATVSTRATQTSVDTIDNFIDTEIATIISNQATIASYIDTEIGTIITNLSTLTGYVDTEVAAIKAVTDKVDTALVLDGAVYQWTANALELGPSGSGLDAAGVRAAIGMSSANLDTQLATIDDFLDTEVAAIKAKTDNLPTDPADASDIAAAFSSVNSTLTTIASYIDTEVAAILTAVDTEVAAIKAKTDNLPADPADASDIATRFTTIDSNLATVDTVVDAIKLKTDALPSDPADASVVAGLIAAVEAKVDIIDTTADAILADTAVIGATGGGLTSLASAADLAAVDTVVDAVKVVTDKLDTALVLDGVEYQFTANALELAPTGGAGLTAQEVWEYIVETGFTAQEVVNIMSAALAGKVSGAGTGTETFRNLNDDKNRIISTVDNDGNRTAVSVDGT